MPGLQGGACEAIQTLLGPGHQLVNWEAGQEGLPARFLAAWLATQLQAAWYGPLSYILPEGGRIMGLPYGGDGGGLDEQEFNTLQLLYCHVARRWYDVAAGLVAGEEGPQTAAVVNAVGSASKTLFQQLRLDPQHESPLVGSLQRLALQALRLGLLARASHPLLRVCVTPLPRPGQGQGPQLFQADRHEELSSVYVLTPHPPAGGHLHLTPHQHQAVSSEQDSGGSGTGPARVLFTVRPGACYARAGSTASGLTYSAQPGDSHVLVKEDVITWMLAKQQPPQDARVQYVSGAKGAAPRDGGRPSGPTGAAHGGGGGDGQQGGGASGGERVQGAGNGGPPPAPPTPARQLPAAAGTLGMVASGGTTGAAADTLEERGSAAGGEGGGGSAESSGRGGQGGGCLEDKGDGCSSSEGVGSSSDSNSRSFSSSGGSSDGGCGDCGAVSSCSPIHQYGTASGTCMGQVGAAEPAPSAPGGSGSVAGAPCGHTGSLRPCGQAATGGGTACVPAPEQEATPEAGTAPGPAGGSAHSPPASGGGNNASSSSGGWRPTAATSSSYAAVAARAPQPPSLGPSGGVSSKGGGCGNGSRVGAGPWPQTFGVSQPVGNSRNAGQQQHHGPQQQQYQQQRRQSGGGKGSQAARQGRG